LFQTQVLKRLVRIYKHHFKSKCVAYPQDDFLFTIFLWGSQAQPYPIKKTIETPKQPIETKNISKKSMFRTLKVKRSQKLVWGLPDGVCRLYRKSLKKIIGSSNQPIRTSEHFPKKKYIYYLKSVKEPKIRMEAT
jgi:hypothetical protein